METFNALEHSDKLSASTPDSSVGGADNRTAEILVRWMAVPIWIAGPGSPGLPDGVIILGSVVNGACAGGGRQIEPRTWSTCTECVRARLMVTASVY
jgi:hypothetical protein